MKHPYRYITLVIALCSIFTLHSETLIWTGASDGNSFWNTDNWVIRETNKNPTSDQLQKTTPIDFDIQITQSINTIQGGNGIADNLLCVEGRNIILNNAALAFDVYNKRGIRGSSSLTPIEMQDSYLGIDVLHNLNITLRGSSSISIYQTALSCSTTNSTINMAGDRAWVGFRNIKKEELTNKNLSFITINGDPVLIDQNIELLPYYSGTLIRLKKNNQESPLTIYTETDFGGESDMVEPYNIYLDDQIPLGNNSINSFKLHKGYMLTLSQNNDGTGMSKVYVAAEKDLNIALLPDGLTNDVSFVRVLPWRYTNKRGVGGNEPKISIVNPGWYYNWGNKTESTDKVEYVPMAWGKYAVSEANINGYIAKKEITHLLAFNEPDGADQANMTPVAAVPEYKKLLRTGLRIGAPSPTEGGINSWIPPFMKGCEANNYRVDFICVHWYDWGNWLSTKNPNPNVDNAVTRFKNYLQKVYNTYKLPIWITEFNINKNRYTAVQNEFLEKMIPILESLEYVERYAYFNPFPAASETVGYGEFTDKENKITSTGIIYRDIEHVCAIASPAFGSSGSLLETNTPQSIENVPMENKYIKVNKSNKGDSLIVETMTSGTLMIYNSLGIMSYKTSLAKGVETIPVYGLQNGIYYLSFVSTKGLKTTLKLFKE